MMLHLAIANFDWRLIIGSSDYMPHGNCYLWQTPLIGLHVTADLITAIAYFSIPMMLVYFVRKKQDTPFSIVFLLFSAFIVSCGIGHLLDVVTLWLPIYWISGIEHGITALISAYTAIELYSLLPQFLSLKSPKDLELINQQLQAEISERQKTDAILNQIIEGTAAVTGTDFFPALVKHLAIALDVQQVQIAEILNLEIPEDVPQTIAMWRNPKYNGTVLVPQDEEKENGSFTSYLRVPIKDRNNQTIGLLRIFHNQATLDREQATKIVTIFASRAAAEIERKRALEQLENINNKLEKKVAERTQALKTANETLQERIRDQRLTAEALRTSEERFRSLVSNIPGAVYRCLPDADWTMEFLSGGVEAITGYPATDFLNNTLRTFGEIIHPEDHTRVAEFIDTLTSRQPSFSAEYRVIRSDGNIAWVYEQGTGIFDDQGKLQHLEGVMLEVTERKMANQVLEQERRQLRQLIQNMPVGIAMFDTNMHYIAHSQQWLKDYQIEQENLIGRSHYDIFPELPVKYTEVHRRGLQGEIIHCDEDVFVQADGTKTYMKWSLQPWYYSPNQVGGLVLVSQNISALVEGREAALEASRLKSSFLANMSHEIRTPMSGILGIAEILKSSELSAQQQDFVETLNNSAHHLLYLLNDILDFSKLEAGEMHLEKTRMDVVNCVESVAELLAPQAHQKKIELLTYIEPEVPQTVQGDPVRLRQILTNLVGNAIKFTTQGSVFVKVGRVVEENARVSIHFEIMDTGIGIKPEDQKKLFHSFSQVDPSTTRQYGGTGLGLAISKQLVTLMGGEIGVQSVWEQGATFWFTARFDCPESQPPLLQLTPQNILVIDSYALSNRVVTESLQKLGMVVTHCQDLMEALVLLEKQDRYDQIIYNLPICGASKGHSHGALGKLKGLLPLERLILAVSQVDYGALKMWLRDEGIRYLLKPLQRRAIWNALEPDLVAIAPDDLLEPQFLATTLGELSNRQDPFRFLLVEDTLVNQKVIVNQLRLLGFERVTVVNNGKEALKHLQKQRHSYDVIFMDCLMPELDGYDTTRAIRRRETGEQHQLIVAMTANAMEGDREKCLATGMDDYISKPTTINSLGAVLLRLLEHQSSKGKKPQTDSSPTTIQALLPPAAAHDLDHERDNAHHHGWENGRDESSEPPKPAIDLQRLTQFYGPDPDFHRQMFREIKKHIPRYLNDMKQAIADQDVTQIAYHAHRLKGSVSTASMEKIPQWCVAIQEETEADTQDFAQIEHFASQIEDQLAIAFDFIDDYLAQG